MQSNLTYIEARIIRAVLRRAMGKQYTVSVYDSVDAEGEYTVKRSRDVPTIMAALATTGGDILVIRDANGGKLGTITLIYNGDDSVIADHTDNAAIGELCH